MGFKIFMSLLGQKIKDRRNDLMMGIGTAGVLGGTALLCRESVKLQDILEEYRDLRDELDEDDKKEMRTLRMKTAGKVVLNFLPGSTMEIAGLTSMWGGYSGVKTALVGMGAAYSGLQEFIDKYREGVREKYGEEADEELAYGFHKEDVVVTKEDGTQETETVRIYPKRKGMPSPYARYFAYGEADGAEKSLTYNKHFLEAQQKVFNGSFYARRKIMLNDVYRALGFKESKAGNHVGWVYDKNAPVGDNYIDLRIQEVMREREDGEGWEKVLMIDPNVDGMVEDKCIRMGLMDE